MVGSLSILLFVHFKYAGFLYRSELTGQSRVGLSMVERVMIIEIPNLQFINFKKNSRRKVKFTFLKSYDIKDDALFLVFIFSKTDGILNDVLFWCLYF